MLLDFLLNRGTTVDEAPVEAPAFSLTKVLVAASAIITPLAAVLVEAIGSVNFTSGQIVALVLGVLAFLALISTADVLARGSVASAKLSAAAVAHAAQEGAGATRDAALSSQRVAELELAAAETASRNRWTSGNPGVVLLDVPWAGRLSAAGENQPVTVLAYATCEGSPCYLCQVGDGVRWLRSAEVVLPATAPAQRSPSSPQARDLTTAVAAMTTGVLEAFLSRADQAGGGVTAVPE